MNIGLTYSSLSECAIALCHKTIAYLILPIKCKYAIAHTANITIFSAKKLAGLHVKQHKLEQILKIKRQHVDISAVLNGSSSSTYL